MVMMMQYCECCECGQWFTLHQVLTSTTTAKLVWRCYLCNWEVDYQKPKTALDEYLYELLEMKTGALQ